MKKLISNCYKFLFAILLTLSLSVLTAEGKNSFVITSPNDCTQLILNENEDELVHTATGLFSDDIYDVSGQRPELTAAGNSKYQIRIGTLGVDKDFDKACKKSGINVDKLQSQWEAYTIKVVGNFRKSTLLVVGSNSRGTAYGLMELSRMIGVSPWRWWADVKPRKRETVILPGDLFLEDAPKVKFRGIFLNDEDWGLQPWAAKTFEPETGDIGPKTYAKIFELLLRLKANAIWPAMHPCTRAFFTYPDNIKMADKYGIWVGSSHCEPMLRNNVDEWYRWNPSSGKRGKWNFDENPEQVTEYWKKRVEATKNYDGIYTVGMRGIHDGSMPGGKNIDDKVEILGRVLNTQRNLLKEITKKEITSIPQVFCPYKEVLQLYKAGAEIPDDVTIMWADDNYGYIRQLSDNEERERSGGAGVYYHISYWGRPHDYLWLESIPVALIWEEMHKAYQTHAKNVWIVNVGDIKSIEVGMNFFLEMAWNPDQFTPETLDGYYTRFAASQFGDQYAEEIGELLRKYFELGFSRKPEHMGWTRVYPNTAIQDPELSLFCNGDEVQARIDAYENLEKEAEQLLQKMPAHLKDAFYQLVAYKVIGAANMNKKILYAYKSRIYAEQGRMSANFYAQKSEAAFEKIKRITAFYNDTLAGGKWKYMMSYNPRELPVFGEAPTGNYNPTQDFAGALIPEGFSNPDDSTVACLPVFNSSTDRSYFVDIFNSGKQALEWKIEEIDPWLIASKVSGNTIGDERIWVSIDWDAVSSEDTVKSEIIFKINNKTYPVQVKAVKTELNSEEGQLFAEDNGIIAIEAENFNRMDSTAVGYWQTIQGLGRASDAVGSYPVTAKSFNLDELSESPELSYDFYSTSTGDVNLKFYCLPNQPINEDYKLRFVVSIDNGEPEIVNAGLKKEMHEKNGEWQKNVLQAASIQTITSKIETEGKHTLTIRMIDPGVVLDKIEIHFGESKKSYFGSPETLIMNN